MLHHSISHIHVRKENSPDNRDALLTTCVRVSWYIFLSADLQKYQPTTRYLRAVDAIYNSVLELNFELCRNNCAAQLFAPVHNYPYSIKVALIMLKVLVVIIAIFFPSDNHYLSLEILLVKYVMVNEIIGLLVFIMC